MSENSYTLIEPEAAHRALEAKDGGQLVDVREAGEVDTIRIEGALNLPLSRLRELAARLDRSLPVYLLCRSGGRAASAAGQLQELGHRDILVVRGGLDAWMASGKPVVRGERRVWSMERQVRFTGGLLVFIGTTAGLTADRRFFILPALVGLGFMFSAATDTCAMALVLARLPWNRGSGGACGR
ncbi:MAG: rhodanese-like domain-containing protein [Elusimicrobia bacterium]|nr:rhodanese-like domain-containing protein [Elusimicrobiota bacterium]